MLSLFTCVWECGWGRVVGCVYVFVCVVIDV